MEMMVFSSFRKVKSCKLLTTILLDVTNQMQNTVIMCLNQILNSQFTSSLH